MGYGIRTAQLRIGGMTCVSCQNKIEKKLRCTDGVKSAKVSYSAGTASITYDADVLSLKDIAAVIQKLDYAVLTGKGRRKSGAIRAAGLLIIIAALYALLAQFGILNLLVPSRLAETNMGYGMLFVIGLLTSVHCVAMCGGINLSQCIPRGEGGAGESRLAALRPTFLYNFGRVISYTAVGFIVGALGSAITFSTALQGALKLLAGVFMVIMGLNMLGIFPWLRRLNPRLPKALALRIGVEKARSNSPLIVGLLNGLMPCGPLQAMQIYALSTGNPFAGALSMLLFSLGTVPLMFGLGALSSILSRKLTQKVMTVGAVLVVVLGLFMLSQGWNLSGIDMPRLFPASVTGTESGVNAAGGATIEDGVQIVNSTLASGRYPSITVQAGTPVRWTIDAPKGTINGCNNRMYIDEYGIEHSFQTGENVIEFTPENAGKYQYTCWMGMIRGTITVVDAGSDQAYSNSGDSSQPDAQAEISGGAPAPAGYRIPTDSVEIAELETDENGEAIQVVEVELTDEGFSPAVVIAQSDRYVQWNIRNLSSDAEAELMIPAYYAQLPLEAGDNILYVPPTDSFDFSTGDSAFYGYVKTVDDLDEIDVEAIKTEVAAYTTLIYPEAYFLDADVGASCH